MKKRITYKDSGVDIGKANAFIAQIRKDMTRTFSPSVLSSSGAFGSLFSLDIRKYKNPVLVSSSDGVGTKLLVAKALGRHDTVGIDLVAMNVNDILCCGAQPLFFLDYLACGRLNPVILKNVVKGIARGCQQSGCSLIGGETAELPGMYKGDDYDLAGFAVGVVEKSKIITGKGIREGDVVLGLPSSGLHSNGFSLARKVLTLKEQKEFSRELLAPTKIYAKEIKSVLGKFKVKGVAHITGGAFYDKLTKILPRNRCFSIDKKSWPVPKIFQIIQKKGRISDREMYRTFNMGIGLAMVFAPRDLARVSTFLKKKKMPFYVIGTVIDHPQKKVIL